MHKAFYMHACYNFNETRLTVQAGIMACLAVCYYEHKFEFQSDKQTMLQVSHEVDSP